MLPALKTILYATDLASHSTHAFRYAMSLAQTYDGSVHVVHAVTPLGPTARTVGELYLSDEQRVRFLRDAESAAIREIETRVEQFCEQELCTDPQDRGRVAGIRVRVGRPGEVILKEAERCGADVIVMGSHGHSPIGELLLGTTAHQVTHRAAVPVLVARPAKE